MLPHQMEGVAGGAVANRPRFMGREKEGRTFGMSALLGFRLCIGGRLLAQRGLRTAFAIRGKLGEGRPRRFACFCLLTCCKASL